MALLSDTTSSDLFLSEPQHLKSSERRSILITAIQSVLYKFVSIWHVDRPHLQPSGVNHMREYAREVLSLGMLYVFCAAGDSSCPYSYLNEPNMHKKHLIY